MSRFFLARRQHMTFSSNHDGEVFLCLQDVETAFQLRTRDARRLDVREEYDSPSRLLRPCWEGCLNILYGIVKRGTA